MPEETVERSENPEKTEKNPDYFGGWKDKSGETSLFFMNINHGKNNLIWGDMVDKDGRSLFVGQMYKNKINFNRDYTSKYSSPDSTHFTLAHECKLIKGIYNCYKGKYKSNDRNSPDPPGKFFMGPFSSLEKKTFSQLDKEQILGSLEEFRKKYSF